jgi:hypothetical protein
MTHRLFAWGEGQESNLGDSVLRRGLLRRLEHDAPLHVYVGTCGEGYLSALGLGPGAVLYRSQRSWHTAILRSVLVRQTHIVMSAGEAIADRRSVPLRAAFVAEGLLARIRGGGIIQTGVGIRRPIGRWKIPLILNAMTCTLLTWRDSWSRAQIGRGEVAPDWAIGEGPAAPDPGGARDVLAVALRGDRPSPSARWTQMVRRIASDNRWKIVVVSQVAVDDPAGALLAKELGGAHIGWGDGNHARLEESIRAVYSRSAVVLSDRLHALLIGATEGAIPVASGSTPPEKAMRTLETIGLGSNLLSLDSAEDDAARGAFDEIAASGAATTAAVLAAREELDRLEGRVRSLVRLSARKTHAG